MIAVLLNTLFVYELIYMHIYEKRKIYIISNIGFILGKTMTASDCNDSDDETSSTTLAPLKTNTNI